jgi:hypothetical protein
MKVWVRIAEITERLSRAGPDDLPAAVGEGAFVLSLHVADAVGVPLVDLGVEVAGDLGQVGEIREERDPPGDVPVDQHGDFRVVQAGLVQQVGPVDRRAVRGGVVLQQEERVVVAADDHALSQDLPVAVGVQVHQRAVQVGIGGLAVGVALEGLDEATDVVGVVQVVVVEIDDVFSPDVFDGLVERAALAPVLGPVDELEPVVGELVDDVFDLLAAVADDEDLEVVVLLVQGRPDRRGQVLRAVVGRDDVADQRASGCVGLSGDLDHGASLAAEGTRRALDVPARSGRRQRPGPLVLTSPGAKTLAFREIHQAVSTIVAASISSAGARAGRPGPAVGSGQIHVLAAAVALSGLRGPSGRSRLLGMVGSLRFSFIGCALL